MKGTSGLAKTGCSHTPPSISHVVGNDWEPPSTIAECVHRKRADARVPGWADFSFSNCGSTERKLYYAHDITSLAIPASWWQHSSSEIQIAVAKVHPWWCPFHAPSPFPSVFPPSSPRQDDDLSGPNALAQENLKKKVSHKR